MTPAGVVARPWRGIATVASVVIVALAIVLGTASAGLAQYDDTLTVRVLPDNNRRALDVAGRGFAPGSPVRLVLAPQASLADAPSADGLPLELDVVEAREDGSFSATTTVPDEVESGPYLLEAHGTNPDGSDEVVARKVEVGRLEEGGGDQVSEVFRWVGYALIALGGAIVLAFAGRWVAGLLANR